MECHLRAEAPGWDFDRVKRQGREAWNAELGKLRIEGGRATKENFYTSLYHAFINPTVYMDADGSYRGLDQLDHTANGFVNYTTFSLWDTHRALHPLLILLRPQSDVNDFIRSLLASWRYSPDGLLPVWQCWGQETWTMIGYHAVPVIADAYLK